MKTISAKAAREEDAAIREFVELWHKKNNYHEWMCSSDLGQDMQARILKAWIIEHR